MEHGNPDPGIPAGPYGFTREDRLLVELAVLEAIDAASARIATLHDHAIAEDVHARLLRRIKTGTTFADPATWLDDDGGVRAGAVRAWMRAASDGESLRARRRRPPGITIDELVDIPAPSSNPESSGVIAAADDDQAQLLADLRRATRTIGMHPRTRDIALTVLRARLQGETFAAAAARAHVPRNTAIQYSRRLLHGVPATLGRRIDRAIRAQQQASP